MSPDFERSLDAIQEAALSEEAWPLVLERLSGAFGGPTMLRQQWLYEPKAELLALAAYRDSGRVDRFFGEFVGSNKNPFVRSLPTLPSGTAVHRAAYAADNEFLRSELYNEVYRPQGIFHTLMLCVAKEKDRAWVLSLTRPESAKAFDSEDEQRLEVMAPHLRRALVTRSHFISRRLHEKALESALDLMPWAIGIVDDSDRLLFANKGFKESKGEIPFGIRGGNIYLQEAADRDKWRNAVRCVVRSGENVHAVLLGCTNCAPTAVLICRLSDSSINNSRQFMVVMSSGQKRGVGEKEHFLSTLLGISSAEARVVSLLIEGETLDRIGLRLGISDNTVRTHIKRVFAATNVHRQHELLASLARTPAALL